MHSELFNNLKEFISIFVKFQKTELDGYGKRSRLSLIFKVIFVIGIAGMCSYFNPILSEGRMLNFATGVSSIFIAFFLSVLLYVNDKYHPYKDVKKNKKLDKNDTDKIPVPDTEKFKSIVFDNYISRFKVYLSFNIFLSSIILIIVFIFNVFSGCLNDDFRGFDYTSVWNKESLMLAVSLVIQFILKTTFYAYIILSLLYTIKATLCLALDTLKRK